MSEQNYEEVKDSIGVSLIGVRGNEEMLAQVPNVIVADMAVVFRLNNDEGSKLVTNDDLGKWGVDAESFSRDAMQSAPHSQPATIVRMEDMLGVPEEFRNPDDPVLHVATNRDGFLGAGVISYPGFMDEAAEKLGGDFFILPSSVHEVILLKGDEPTTPSISELKQMVTDINASEVSEADKLTDNVYHYDSREKVFEPAEQFAERKAMEAQMQEGKHSVLKDLKEKEKAAKAAVPGTEKAAKALETKKKQEVLC